jgi:ectoine hydroxylase-related dioxygenase (phytanoyl-CoA dioxygenase family)
LAYDRLVMANEQSTDAPHATRDIERVKADIARYGFGILEGALPPAITTAIRDRLLDQAAAERAKDVDISNASVEPDDDVNQWVAMLPNKGRVFRELINNQACLDPVRFVLGKDAILSEFSAHITWPGNKEMALHIDQWFMPQPAMPSPDYRRAADATRSDQPFGEPEPARHAINVPVVANAMWAISDFTRENGATRLVPGSHLSGRHPEPGRAYDCVWAEAPAGSIVIWEGRTWHAASLNTGNSPRLGITTYWGAPFLRQLLNFTYGLRPEVAADHNENERALMGYRVWQSYGATGNFNAAWATPGAENLGELSSDDKD